MLQLSMRLFGASYIRVKMSKEKKVSYLSLDGSCFTLGEREIQRKEQRAHTLCDDQKGYVEFEIQTDKDYCEDRGKNV